MPLPSSLKLKYVSRRTLLFSDNFLLRVLESWMGRIYVSCKRWERNTTKKERKNEVLRDRAWPLVEEYIYIFNVHDSGSSYRYDISVHFKFILSVTSFTVGAQRSSLIRAELEIKLCVLFGFLAIAPHDILAQLIGKWHRKRDRVEQCHTHIRETRVENLGDRSLWWTNI